MDDNKFLATFGITREEAIASNGELSHAGVKGMKWGHRKADKPAMGNQAAGSSKGKFTSKKAPEPYNRQYSIAKRTEDRRIVGKGGVKAVNKRMNEGQSHDQALRSVRNRQAAIAGAVGGASYFIALGGPKIAASLGKAILQDAAFAKQASAAAKAANNLFSDSMGLTSYQTISLAMDASGRWR